MNIPEGWRLVGDDEVIQDTWKRASKISDNPVPINLSSGQKDRTRRFLLANGLIPPHRIFLAPTGEAKPSDPKFPGWIEVGVDAPTMEGDIGVLDNDKAKLKCDNKYSTPDSGLSMRSQGVKIGVSMRQSFPHDKNIKAGAWTVYRRVKGGNVFYRRLPPNPEQLTKPLPLP